MNNTNTNNTNNNENKPYNEVKLSLIISNDQTNRDGTVRNAVRRVSDKLTTVQTFMPGRKQQDGTYGPSASLTVNVINSEKLVTKMDGVKLEAKAHIDVFGYFQPDAYTDPTTGKTRTYFVLVAREIRVSNRPTNTGNTGTFQTVADTTAPDPVASAPAASAPAAPAPAVNTSAPVEEDEDLPFLI